MAAEAPDPPLGRVSLVHKLSRYNVNHPDYAAMSVVERRRAITKRLRACNFGILTEEFKTSDRDRIRATVESPITDQWQGTYEHAQSNGIVWCRCFGPWLETFRYNPAFILAGEPVIFDVYSGNAVAPYPRTTMGLIPSREWNDDEFFIVGKAVTGAVKIKDGPTDAEDEYMVAVQLIPQNPVNELYNKTCWAFAQPIANVTHPIMQPGYTGNPRYRFSEPKQHEWYDYALAPAESPSRPAWADMRIFGLPEFHTEDPNQSTWQKKEGYSINLEAEHARVLNYGPFGYKNYQEYGYIIVRKAGDVYIAEKPQYSHCYPFAKFRFGASGKNEQFTLSASTSGSSTNFFTWVDGYGIVGDMPATSTSTRKYIYLPNMNVRYQVSVEMISRSNTGSGGTGYGYAMNTMPVGVWVNPFGQFPNTLDWYTANGGFFSQTRFRTIAPTPPGGFLTTQAYTETNGTFGEGPLVTKGPWTHIHTSDIVMPTGWNPNTDIGREVTLTINTDGWPNFECQGNILIRPVYF